ncbi:MAG: hypothetical protein WCO84_02090 [bacterium]
MKNCKKSYIILVLLITVSLFVVSRAVYFSENKRIELPTFSNTEVTGVERLPSSEVTEQITTIDVPRVTNYSEETSVEQVQPPIKSKEIVTRDKFQKSTDGTVTLSARKTQSTVEVQIKKNGTLIKGFTFDEIYPADNSGNSWTARPPSIDLSPDGIKIAYSDTEGLKIFNLLTEITQKIRIHPSFNNPQDEGIGFVDPFWFPDSKYIGYSQTSYEGSRFGVADSTTGEYNDFVLRLSPSTIEAAQVKGKSYLIYSTSQDNEYGGSWGLFVAEVVSVQDIKFVNLIDSIKTEVDVTKVSFDNAQNLIVFEFYRDLYKPTKAKYRGTISIDGSNFSETKIAD